MKKYKWIIILINLIILLGLFNNSILQKEELLTDGQLVLLELAPVDPRSLMQGDYMRLRYAISDNINSDSISKRGFCVVKLEENGIAKKVRIQENKTPISSACLRNTAFGFFSMRRGDERRRGEYDEYVHCLNS